MKKKNRKSLVIKKKVVLLHSRLGITKEGERKDRELGTERGEKIIENKRKPKIKVAKSK